MNKQQMIDLWKQEERIAHIHGWDFSHINGRYAEEDDLPWDYRQIILQHLKPEMRLLDIDTGGGEFLLSLNHPFANTSATEGYPPNVDLCRQKLIPLGIDFRAADGNGRLPFDNASFDIIINRHGAFNASELRRVLRDGGIFITQQVGAQNDRELTELLLGNLPLPFPEQTLTNVCGQLRKAGFRILDSGEHFGKIRFYDVGALVWFARVIAWEFPGFCVSACESALLNVQRLLAQNGSIEGRTHRFFLATQKAGKAPLPSALS